MIRALLLIALALQATPLNAEIYKCAGKDAMPVYQNFPCENDTLGSPPLPVSKGPTAAAGMRTTQKHPVEPVRNAASTPQQAAPGDAAPRVGMTTSEVRAIWGPPVDFSREEPAKGDIEVWTYSDSRSVHFDRKGRVTAIHW
jgi:hypothetical protein